MLNDLNFYHDISPPDTVSFESIWTEKGRIQRLTEHVNKVHGMH